MPISGEFLGLIAGGCTTLAFLPQVYRVWKTRSVKDISTWMYLIYCLGLALWIVYGVSLDLLPIVVANVVTLGLASTILGLKILWHKS
jgi:MtN3 and saliva related transmembrane protein